MTLPTPPECGAGDAVRVTVLHPARIRTRASSSCLKVLMPSSCSTLPGRRCVAARPSPSAEDGPMTVPQPATGIPRGGTVWLVSRVRYKAPGVSRLSSASEGGSPPRELFASASCPCVESTTGQHAILKAPLSASLRDHRHRQSAVSPTAPLLVCRCEQGLARGSVQWFGAPITYWGRRTMYLDSLVQTMV